MAALAPDAARTFVDALWDDSILPALAEYVAIPAKSPHFDPDWQEHGELERAIALAERWCRAQPVRGLTAEVVRLPGRTPLLLLEAPGTGSDTALVYGHLDKQPELEPWSEGLGPWRPVRRGDRLYGRGGADDGYAVFALGAALGALHAQGVAHARCIALFETCEESGSFDLPAYLEHLRARIGTPSLVVCLDSGCGDYQRLWCTTSLRGIAAGVLRVRVLEEGVHSGDASGVVPSSFRIARALLSRLEDERSGRIRPEFHVAIPAERAAQAEAAARVLGPEHWRRFPFAGSTGAMAGEAGHPLAGGESGPPLAGGEAGPSRARGEAADAPSDDTERVLNRTWRPFLEVTGAGGLPALTSAGNVLRPETALKLSLRLPPRLDADAALARLRSLLEADPPAGAHVRFEPDQAAHGWDAPALAPWLAGATRRASRAWFGAEPAFMGEGGTIPFMAMLGAAFPAAQFLVTGVLGPGANAHGPNEFLHLPTARRLSGCVAQILAEHAVRSGDRPPL
ncbi:MAG: M20/M25/M40 family metallo-hydrolase [Deltaproteobacteria bacterium]|nr:M20/M25/M40 family metallo-hydrolase [Deltaproteobacteria bacterium]